MDYKCMCASVFFCSKKNERPCLSQKKGSFQRAIVVFRASHRLTGVGLCFGLTLQTPPKNLTTSAEALLLRPMDFLPKTSITWRKMIKRSALFGSWMGSWLRSFVNFFRSENLKGLSRWSSSKRSRDCLLVRHHSV